MSKTDIKTEILIYPFSKDTINTSTFIEGICQNDNLSRQNYDSKLWDNIPDEFNEAFKTEKHIRLNDFDIMLRELHKLLKNKKRIVLTTTLKQFKVVLKRNYKDMDIDAFISNNCLSITNIDTNYDEVYKSKHKYRLDMLPLILINDEIHIVKGLIHYSQQYWRNVYNQGIAPYNKKDSITTAIPKVIEKITQKMVNDIEVELKSVNETFRTDTNVEYHDIFGKQEVNYGDFDIIAVDDTKKIILNIEAKYLVTSLTGSGLENNYKNFYNKDGYAFKCNRRNEFMLKHEKIFRNYFNATDYTIHNLMVISKPMDIRIKDDKYNFETIHFQALKDYIKNI